MQENDSDASIRRPDDVPARPTLVEVMVSQG
jgi:hypothetical protein